LGKPVTTPTIDMETALLDAHYQGDPVARFAWLGWCEDTGVRLTEVGVTGVWRGTLAEWLDVGPSLVRRVALERVELVDREPRKVWGKPHWWGYSFPIGDCNKHDFEHQAYVLPNEFFTDKKKPNGYHEYLGDGDASRRAIRWARGQGQEVMG